MPNLTAAPYKAKKRRKIPAKLLQTRTKLAPFVNARPIGPGGGLAPRPSNKSGQSLKRIPRPGASPYKPFRKPKRRYGKNV